MIKVKNREYGDCKCNVELRRTRLELTGVTECEYLMNFVYHIL